MTFNEGTVEMIVVGADTHKRSHTAAAVAGATARVLADLTVKAKRRSFEDLLRWARGLGGERVWAIEDCRHVSDALERFLLKRGERVVRVPPKLMAGARSSARERGKSDRIDAVAIARAALREGLDALPVAQLAGPELEVRLLVDHRELMRLVDFGCFGSQRFASLRASGPGRTIVRAFVCAPQPASVSSPGRWRP